MHVAIAVGTLLLGGWVLESPTTEDEIPSPPTSQTLEAAPGEQSQIPLFAPAPQARTDIETLPQRMRRHRATFVPSAPTERSQADADGEGGVMKPSAPTSGAPLQNSMMGLRMNQSQSGRSPLAPTSRRPGTVFQPYGRGIAEQSQRALPYMSISSLAKPSEFEKAFSGYKPTSGVSPYMNLYRSDNLGTIDNYTTLVRPQVEQRFLNQQVGQDIRGLQRGYNLQGANLHQLNRETRTLEGVSTPQFYQDYGPYYQFGQ